MLRHEFGLVLNSCLLPFVIFADVMADNDCNSYQIGEIFELVYVPEIDGVLAQQGATGG